MPLQRFDGFPSAYEVGNNAGSFLAKAADAAADFACGLYQDFPGAVIPASQIVSLNPSSNMVRGVWDGLCAPRGKTPPPPTPPITGGQCKCTAYRWTAKFKSSSSATEQTGTGTFTGRAEVITRMLQGSETIGRKELYSYPCSGGVETGQRVLQHAANYETDGGYDNITITKVNGTPDTCGDPPPQFPPSAIPSNRTTNITNINLPGITVPVGVAYVPVNINPTLNVSPNIRVDLGGLNVQFDLGGATVNFPDITPAPSGQPSIPPGNSDKPDCPPCPALPPSTEPPTPGTDPPETPPGSGDDKDAPGITYLEVRLTSLPNKVQSGNDGETIYYAGWVSFRSATGYFYPREPIHFQQSIFAAPPGCDGYTITYTNQAAGVERFYTEEDTST